MTGHVILVGAGPGDPGLLTRKGLEAISQAQVVVYDRLVGPEILALIPRDAETIDVGKQASHHPVPQEQINRILLEQAQRGKRVVRLKGGDPFLFGRGGEELALLQAQGIPFQVVPGVTSALSVPAYAGIPVTHRDFCSSVHIITGHARAGAPLNIPFQALKDTRGTLVFLMGVSALPQICQGLLEAGMDPQTPAAVIEKGTLPEQRKLVCTLADLPGQAAQAAIGHPAIIVVGPVCSLSEDFDWFSRLPLAGKTVIVTRPENRRGTLCHRLSQLGAKVICYPCIRTVAKDPCPALDAAIDRLAAFSWLVFTSPAGPEIFFARLKQAGKDARALAGCRIAAIGPKTAQAVEQYGLTPDLVPEIYDSEHLAKALKNADGKVLICRAQEGSAALPETFRETGIAFEDVACYDTVYESPAAGEILPLLEAPVLVTFTSASTVRGFVNSLPEGTDLSQVIGCCIGRQTAQAAAGYGISTLVAQEATMDSLIDCIKGGCV